MNREKTDVQQATSVILAVKEVSQAALLGDAARLREILKIQPTLVNTENTDGLTPLGYAAHYGHIETVQGAPLDTKNNDGNSSRNCS